MKLALYSCFNVIKILVNCNVFGFSPTPLVVSDEHGQEETPAQQQARMSASSATRELDELMASLSDFKVQSNVSMGPKLLEKKRPFDKLKLIIFDNCTVSY